MAVDSKHPKYNEFLPDWTMMHDVHKGERKIKEEGDTYLPVTSGQEADGLNAGQAGQKAYSAYKKRAAFSDVVRSAVEAMVGVMHHKPPVIELPAVMEGMREHATLKNESLEMLLRRINEWQLITGRLGILLDVADNSPVGTLPYVAMYQAATILNWDDGQTGDPLKQNLNFVSLNESENQRVENFEWEFVRRHRLLILGDPQDNEGANEGAIYQVAVVEGEQSQFDASLLVTPSLAGKPLDQIPFVFINAKDIVPDPDAPPLLGLANLALTIYRGEADYRQALFMQGQDTLVVIGAVEEKSYRVGANASIQLPGGPGNDAKFIGVDSSGLTEMREALENDKKMASEKGGQLMDTTSREKESGDALKIRVAARTATLNQIVLAGAFGLETLLKMAAVWLGANPDEVVVEPNLDFADDELLGKTLVEYMTAKSMGAPFSLESIHNLMREKDLTKLEFKEEIAQIEEEEPLGLGAPDDDLDDGGPGGAGSDGGDT